MNSRRRILFTRARRPVAIAMRAVAEALPGGEVGGGRRSVYSARAKKLIALLRGDEGVH